jgi:hypothetical protein
MRQCLSGLSECLRRLSSIAIAIVAGVATGNSALQTVHAAPPSYQIHAFGIATPTEAH